jgi:pyruvate dehydrogenase E2 component (dihydrolipoamide acetyltransferase)
MTEVIMTKMGDAMEEGTLLKWRKGENESVQEGEPIADIQTDKANVELVAPASGLLVNLKVKEGDTVPVGVVIAYVAVEGESLTSLTEQDKLQPKGFEFISKSDSSTERIKASPIARKIASEKGINLAQVQGSGPGGRIVERDIEQYIQTHQGQVPALPPQGMPAGLVPGEPIELTRTRRLIAQRTTVSKQTVPHFYVTSKIDMEALLTLRAKLNSGENALKLSINDFIIKACAVAITKFPQVNSVYLNDKLIPILNVNIGVMVAIPDGLVVPVLKECEKKSLRTIATEAKVLFDKAREGTLSLNEMTGSTFGLSNLGMFDVDEFSAIIFPPNAAILAIATAKKVPVVLEDGAITARTRMKVTLSVDHRVLDGVIGAQFLKEIKTLIENPVSLVV